MAKEVRWGIISCTRGLTSHVERKGVIIALEMISN